MADVVQKSEVEAPAPESERERSTIAFPYNDLEDAEKIAAAVFAVGGSAGFDQVAGHLKVSADTGAFRYRLQVARMFGLVSYNKGNVTLTPLGRQLNDPDQVIAARAQAFLTIPLYKRVYDEYKGGVLPPNKGLETAMEGFGVAKKQTDKARQVMQRSATLAGFNWAGTNRLVLPKGMTEGGMPAPAPADKPKPEDKPGDDHKPGGHGRGDHGGDGGKRDPLLQGLINKLPKEGTDWPVEDRVAWLDLARGIFDFVYGKADSITVAKTAKSNGSA